jgi:predicted metal-dependent hydrolase
MRLSVEYQDRIIDFHIEYRNRKTMAIHIRPPASVLVLSPVGTPEKVIRERVKSKGRWILKKLSEVRHLDPEKFKKDFANGESFLFLGKNYDLKIVRSSRKIPKVFFREGVFYLETSVFKVEELSRAMEKWYRKKAERIINDRVEMYSGKIGKRPRTARVKEQKQRWGSCTSKGDLYFNWRCVMAPPGIIDYLVVHEMSHLIHSNHSRAFWEEVGSIMPDYKKRKKWLKENGLKLDI